MKKVLGVIVVFILLLTISLSIVYAGENDIKVMLNGKYVDFDVEPQVINDRTMVPFRAIFEAMGASVEWNQELWQASGEKDGTRVSMVIGSNEVVINENGEERIIKIDQAPIIVDGRTLVPVRFVAEAFDKIVTWDEYEKTVIILDLQGFAQQMKKKAPNFYEYVSTLDAIPSNFRQIDEFEFSIAAEDKELKEEGEEVIVGKLESIVNEEDAYFGISIDISGSGIANIESKNLTVDMYIKDNDILIKVDFGEEEDNQVEFNGEIYNIKDEGIRFNIDKLAIPGVSNFKDLKNFINTMLVDLDKISNIINYTIDNGDVYIDVEYIKNFVTIYDLFLDFVSNENFVKKELSTQTIYTLEFDKKDIVNIVKAMYLKGMISSEDSLLGVQVHKDINMGIKIYVKDDGTQKVKLDFNTVVQIDSVEGVVKINWEENVTDINNGNIKISHPKYEKGIDFIPFIYEAFKEMYKLHFEYYQDEINEKVKENIQNGKDKFEGIINYTEDTFPKEGYVLNGNVIVKCKNNPMWGIDKKGNIYYMEGLYYEDENITMYNNYYYVEGKGEFAQNIKKMLEEEYNILFIGVLTEIYEDIVESIY